MKEWLRHLFALESSAQPAITSESGKHASQGASAITSVEVPRLTLEEMLRAIRPVFLSEDLEEMMLKISIDEYRAIEAALLSKWSKT